MNSDAVILSFAILSDKMDMRGLSTFIADLRKESALTGGERLRVDRELAKIRSKFQSKTDLSGYHRKKYVCKLMYISILGHEVDFGHIEAIKLMSSSAHSEKTIGYLACNLLIEQESEIFALLINQIRLDIYSKDEATRSLALNFIANSWNRALCDNIIEELQSVFFNNRENDRIWKKAAIALLQVIRNFDGEAQWDRIVLASLEKLEMYDLGAMNASLALLEHVIARAPATHNQIAQKCIIALGGIVLGKKTPNEYIYFGVPSPWTQSKILRILQRLDITHDMSLRLILTQCLTKICNATEKLLHDYIAQRTTKTLNSRLNAMNCVFLEAINTICLYHEESHVPTVSRVIGLFLSSARDSYSIYIGLRALCVFVTAKPPAHEPSLLSIYRKVGDCIYHSDASIQRVAIRVLQALATKENTEEVVGELLNYLDKSPSDIKQVIIESIVAIVQKSGASAEWIINVFFHILCHQRRGISRDIWIQLYRLIQKYDEAKFHACAIFSAKLLESSSHTESFLIACAHVFKLCHTSIPKYPEEQHLQKIHENFPHLSRFAIIDILSCFFEIYRKSESEALRAQISGYFIECSSYIDTQVHQIANELHGIASHKSISAMSAGTGSKLDLRSIFNNPPVDRHTTYEETTVNSTVESKIDNIFDTLSMS